MQLRRAANSQTRSRGTQNHRLRRRRGAWREGKANRERPPPPSDPEESFKSVRSPEPCGVSGGLGGAACHVAGVEGPEEEEETGPLFLKERGRDLGGGSLMDGRQSSVLAVLRDFPRMCGSLGWGFDLPDKAWDNNPSPVSTGMGYILLAKGNGDPGV